MPKLVVFENVSYRYESMHEPLLRGCSISFPTGWSGIVGANGAGKTTILKLACGLLEPKSGSLQLPRISIYCAKRTDDVPGLLEPLIHAQDRQASEIKLRLGILDDWDTRWNTLSHGERKRAQIAIALWQQPDVLALDEPTNHIDADARRMLLAALCNYRGIGLLVSHDRELLDSLCRRCLFLNPPEAVLRPGNYSSGKREASREEARQQPSEMLGRIMTVVSRLGSRPAGLMDSVEPSPGELRKLLLGIGIAQQPYLIIMDEPTNHLDLPSIECLEDALADCPCGLLLVSHDMRFLRRLTQLQWHIDRAETVSVLESRYLPAEPEDLD